MVRLLAEHRAGLIEFGLLLRQVCLTDLALSAKTFHIGGPNSASLLHQLQFINLEKKSSKACTNVQLVIYLYHFRLQNQR